jgi:hypothetical protein
MKKRNIITALALTLAIGMGATAYAASGDSTSTTAPRKGLGLGRITSMRGYDYITNILKNKLGLTDADITKGINEGKTPYKLAEEKGMTQEQLKSALLEERTKAIDAAEANGSITKEEGASLKASLNTNIESCTGNFGQGQGMGQGRCGSSQGQGRGQGRGMMGNGQGRFK